MENTNGKKGASMFLIGGIIIALVIVGAVVVLGRNDSDDTMMDDADSMMQDTSKDSDSMMEEDEGMMEDTDAMIESEGMMEGDIRVFDIEGGSFYYKPNVLTVKAGESVKVVLTSADMMHDFVIEGTDIKTEIAKSGETVEVEFTMDEAGTYEFYCSVGEHRANGMVGTLIVE